MNLASIQLIAELRPIEGADRIEAATVLGYQTVVKKGEFKPGDLCIWHEPDTVVADKPVYEFLRKQNFRLKVSRFRGQVSQGLALPVSALQLAMFSVGDDVTELTGITKYEKPLSPTLSGTAKGFFPTWLRKTDEPNLRSNLELLDCFVGRQCIITQKVDGSSGTFYLRNGEFGVCSRNLDLLDDLSNAFWKIARQYRLQKALATLGGNFAVQGEVYGESIQGNHLGVKGLNLALFNLFDINARTYASQSIFEAFCWANNIPRVVEVCRGEFKFTLQELVALSNSQDYATGRPAEGVVIRPLEEVVAPVRGIERLSAKVISERYALKYGE